jgi:hypothetical protein
VCGSRRSFSDGTHSIRPHGASDPPRARWTWPQTSSRGRFCSIAASSACEPRCSSATLRSCQPYSGMCATRMSTLSGMRLKHPTRTSSS